MKKYFSKMWEILEGYRWAYLLFFVLQFGNVFLSILATYTAKILSDALTGDLTPDLLGMVGMWVVNIFGGVEFLSDLNNIWVFAIIYVSIALCSAIFIVARLLLRPYISTGVGNNTQLKLFNHIERLPFSFLKKCKPGDVIQTCTRDENVLRRFVINQTMTIMYTFDICILSFLILLSLNWKIAVVSIVLLPILFVYSFFLIKEVRRRYRVTDDSEGLMTAKIQENLNAVRIVKAYNNEKYEIDDFETYLDDYKGKYKHWRKLSAFFFSSSDIFVFGQILLTMLFGISLCVSKEITLGTFIISVSFSSMMVWPLRDVATILSDGARAIVSIDRMNLLMNEPLEDIDTGIDMPIKGDIVFDGVSFKYDDGDTEVLRDISLHIKPGETVAIMGKTGSGKSTFSQLLTRLYDYDSGSVKMDGVELKDISKKCVRKHVSCVLQEPFLFSKTIMNNIKIADKTLSNERVYAAASIASIDNDIRSFKNAYDTAIGENGVTLSGGQKQRVAIARSIVSETPILIFDDSLSAVDTETDIKIRGALATRNKGVTTILITHRIATAFDADRIIVLENGSISESGTHEELIKKEGLYKRLYEIQTRMV